MYGAKIVVSRGKTIVTVARVYDAKESNLHGKVNGLVNLLTPEPRNQDIADYLQQNPDTQWEVAKKAVRKDLLKRSGITWKITHFKCRADSKLKPATATIWERL